MSSGSSDVLMRCGSFGSKMFHGVPRPRLCALSCPHFLQIPSPRGIGVALESTDFGHLRLWE